jgi:Protein of unknown function (DUF3108)
MTVRAKSLASLLIAMLVAQVAGAQSSVMLKPYSARYQVKYRGLSGGDIEFTLRNTGNGRFVFNSHLLPNFLGSFFASDQAEDTSHLLFDGNTVKPLQFNSEDGSKNTSKDIHYEFDWITNSVRGNYKDHDFTLQIPTGTQDRLSIQLAASLALQAEREPGQLIMLERNELQEYSIVIDGKAKVRTDAGEYDTVVLKSERKGSNRSTRYWYAARLGYIPVRAERSTNGKVDIVMELKSYQPM